MKNLLFLICSLLYLSLNSSAQKAILYSVDFKISSSLREKIQKTDHFGELVWKELKGKQVPDTYLPEMSDEEVERICESFAEFIKKSYNFSQILILYPGNIEMVSKNQLKGFPNKSLRNALKKNEAAAYISCEIVIKDKNLASLFFDGDQDDPHRYILFNMASEFIIVDNAKKEIDKKSLQIIDFDELFAREYDTSIEKDAYKVSGISYFTTSEMYRLYKMCEWEFNDILMVSQ